MAPPWHPGTPEPRRHVSATSDHAPSSQVGLHSKILACLLAPMSINPHVHVHYTNDWRYAPSEEAISSWGLRGRLRYSIDADIAAWYARASCLLGRGRLRLEV